MIVGLVVIIALAVVAVYLWHRLDYVPDDRGTGGRASDTEHTNEQ